jgi:hypothetical protein
VAAAAAEEEEEEEEEDVDDDDVMEEETDDNGGVDCDDKGEEAVGVAGDAAGADATAPSDACCTR